jgi:hypothetical protein
MDMHYRSERQAKQALRTGQQAWDYDEPPEDIDEDIDEDAAREARAKAQRDRDEDSEFWARHGVQS